MHDPQELLSFIQSGRFGYALPGRGLAHCTALAQALGGEDCLFAFFGEHDFVNNRASRKTFAYGVTPTRLVWGQDSTGGPVSDGIALQELTALSCTRALFARIIVLEAHERRIPILASGEAQTISDTLAAMIPAGRKGDVATMQQAVAAAKTAAGHARSRRLAGMGAAAALALAALVYFFFA